MFYNKQINRVFKELFTNEKGLSDTEAKIRLKKFGYNSLRPEQEKPVLLILLGQFADPLIYILLIAAVFTVVIHHYIDTAAILIVVILNAIIGFVQKYKAEKAMSALKKLTAMKAIAVRNSLEVRIDSSELVPGDIVVLTAGNKVPADLRLFEQKELEIDESAFTGESIPVQKNTKVVDAESIPVMNQTNMAFMGTIITHGKGKGIVVSTGEKTELGKISHVVKTAEREETPLQKKLKNFSISIALISLILSLIVFFIGIFKGLSISEMMLFSISMAVSIIPEGLPIVVTIAMAVGLKKMADKNAIVRRLVAVETLGSCNFICTDKTGTITENQMTVTKAYANGKYYEFSGIGYKPDGEIFANKQKVSENDEDIYRLLLTGLLCNSSVVYEENGEWKTEGDPTEGALITAAAKFGINIEKQEFQYKLVDEVPFSSNRQYMATLYKTVNEYVLFVKGTPEKILSFCALDNDELLVQHQTDMADSGLRVLGFGIKKIQFYENGDVNLETQATNNLQFVGFQGIIDPPRENAVEAIRNSLNAGINVVMLTGDHRSTAVAIARQVGILRENKKVLTGQELDSMNENDLLNIIENVAVYARVSPEHKLKIVTMLQQKGHVVAVTGDGINDAPALKKASIGVAMGKAGTDVAKEASDMVLKDDNFASIFEAVKVGRIVFENIRKVIYFLLGSDGGIPIVIISCLLLGLPLPFLATQVLWINLVSNGMQDIALAYEPGEKHITKRRPLNNHEGIINFALFNRIILGAIVIGAGTLFLYQYKLSHGYDLTYARTTALNTLVFFQFFHVFNSRSFEKSIFEMNPFSNPLLSISLTVAVLAQISILIFPPFQYIFHTTTQDALTWTQSILLASTIIIFVEADKLFVRLKQNFKK